MTKFQILKLRIIYYLPVVTFSAAWYAAGAGKWYMAVLGWVLTLAIQVLYNSLINDVVKDYQQKCLAFVEEQRKQREAEQNESQEK